MDADHMSVEGWGYRPISTDIGYRGFEYQKMPYGMPYIDKLINDSSWWMLDQLHQIITMKIEEYTESHDPLEDFEGTERHSYYHWPDNPIHGDQVYSMYDELVTQIVQDYAGDEVAIIQVMENRKVQMGLEYVIDQFPKDKNIDIDSVHVQRSFDSQGKSQAVLEEDILEDVRDRNVLIMQWAIETGCTTSFLMSHIKNKNPKSIKVCGIIDNVINRKFDLHIDYRVLEVIECAVIAKACNPQLAFPCIFLQV